MSEVRVTNFNLDLTQPEATYIDLQPILLSLPITILFLVAMIPIGVAQHYFIDPTLLTPQQRAAAPSWFFPRPVFVITFVVDLLMRSAFLYWLIRLTWRVSVGLGALAMISATLSLAGIILAGIFIASLGGMTQIPELLDAQSWHVPVFVMMIILPYIALSWYLLRFGLRLVDSDAATRCLCSEVMAGLVHKHSLLAALGIPLSIVGIRWRAVPAFVYFLLSSIVFALAVQAIIYVYGAAAGWIMLLDVIPQRADSVEMMMVRSTVDRYLLVAPIVFILSLWATGLFRDRGKRKVTLSLRELQSEDSRPPILFLRAFQDDQVSLQAPRYWWIGRLLEGRQNPTLDILLLEQGTPYGPVVALGDPRDPLPHYGAARGYFTNAEWQDGVRALAGAAQAIVICLDDTDGIWWEVEHLLSGKHLHKTLFLIHPKHGRSETGAAIVKRVIQTVPALNAAAAPNAPLGFFFDRNGALNVATSSSFSSAAFLLTVRWYFRTCFDHVELNK